MTSPVQSLIQLARPKQWIKNVFVIFPLFFSPHEMTSAHFITTFWGVISFSLVASALYILNDYLDREHDQLHPTKKNRPFVTGAISAFEGLITMLILLIAGLGLGFFLSENFAWILVYYFLLNIAYCTFLKHQSILDIMSIALGFVLRIVAGSVLIAVQPSIWILICTGLLALFIAVAKRRDDVVLKLDHQHRPSLSGYNLSFLDSMMFVVLSALLVTYSLYTLDPHVIEHFHSDHVYLTLPFVVLGIFRYLQIVLVEKKSASPTALIYQDMFLKITVLLWFVVFGCLIYV